MKRGELIVALSLCAFVLLAIAQAPASVARVHDEEICWDPDVEFPVPCDSDED